MTLLDTMKRLDDRVLGPTEEAAARSRNALPWLLALVLVVELLTQLTDLAAPHGAVPFVLAGTFLTALQARRG